MNCDIFPNQIFQQKVMRKFCIVMPIIELSYLYVDGKREENAPTQENNNFRRFFEIGGPFWHKYLVWKDLHSFIIILSEKQKATFIDMLESSVLAPYASKFDVRSQEELLHDFGDEEQQKEWRKSRVQMMSKIAIANHIPTEFYLIIDDDVILKRMFGYEDLFANKKTHRLRFTTANAFHDYWWKGSMGFMQIDETKQAKLLKKLETMKDHQKLLNVTPQIFVTQIARDLYRYAGDSDDIMKTKNTWTEYTLYWLYMMLHVEGGPYKYYGVSKIRLSEDDLNIWFAVDDLENRIAKMMSSKHTYFCLIQSNIPSFSVELVKAALNKSHNHRII